MPIGRDQQYDETPEEQDKVRRRQEIRSRLKVEHTIRNFSPFRHMKLEHYQDPAVERYMDLRNRGRAASGPLNPKIFFTLTAFVFVPIIVVARLVNHEMRTSDALYETGTMPYKDRWRKHQGHA